MNSNKLLIIGLVWPEPTSSAAGTRMIQLINLFLSQQYEITFACAAAKSDFSFDLTAMGVKEQEIFLNDHRFNTFLKALQPDMIVFDRFMIEEQYGWRVQQECPGSIRILDTEDLHFLRHARQQAAKSNTDLQLPLIPADLFTDLAKREIASILRSDLSLIISETEMEILQVQFKISASLIYYLPFLEDELTEETMEKWTPFEERADFVFIGNFLHEPNWHTVKFLKTKIWPLLSARLPAAKLHIYGAYPSQKVTQLHHEKERFLVHGRADHAHRTISKHKILIAPIHFGAGVKGKFIDAMQTGTPSVTTTIGAEAMQGNYEWNGLIADDPELFAEKAALLYENKELWLTAQQNGITIINNRYGKTQFSAAFTDRITSLSANLEKHRQDNFFGQLLQYHTTSSTKYMSLWIAEKNKHKN